MQLSYCKIYKSLNSITDIGFVLGKTNCKEITHIQKVVSNQLTHVKIKIIMV